MTYNYLMLFRTKFNLNITVRIFQLKKHRFKYLPLGFFFYLKEVLLSYLHLKYEAFSSL